MALTTHRRSFFRGVLGAAAIPLGAASAAADEGPEDGWIGEVAGAHRCLFDFPQHKNGVPLLHMLNYLHTYAEAYKAGAGQVRAVGTFYGVGPQSSIALGFNDAMWDKYGLGAYAGLKDAAGKPYTRNVLARPTTGDAHLLMEAMQTPPIPGIVAGMPALGIQSLQTMGAKFLLCANALGGWCMELEARGKGKTGEIEKELRANLLAGVTIVPAMVIAIEKAQEAGIRYNRQ